MYEKRCGESAIEFLRLVVDVGRMPSPAEHHVARSGRMTRRARPADVERTNERRTSNEAYPPCHGDAADRILELGTHTRAWRAPRTASPSQACSGTDADKDAGGLGLRGRDIVPCGAPIQSNPKFAVQGPSAFVRSFVSTSLAPIRSRRCPCDFASRQTKTEWRLYSHDRRQQPVAYRAMLR